MKKTKRANNSKSKILKITAVAENMMAMPKSIILKIKERGKNANGKITI